MTEYGKDFDAKWLKEQRCPRCKQDPHCCDWCADCDLELVCAQTPEGLTVATRGSDPDGTPVLILATKSGLPVVR